MTQMHDLTIASASAKIAKGILSPSSLVESLIQRIDQLEPSVKAWVTIDKSTVLKAAEVLDLELKEKGPRSPLHGIPVGIKDIYYTAGMKTTACSKVYADFVPTYDATAVTRLKEAGAIVLGKTVTTEFAAGDPPPTINPWNPSGRGRSYVPRRYGLSDRRLNYSTLFLQRHRRTKANLRKNQLLRRHTGGMVFGYYWTNGP